ncbi:hypothetical protein [Peribacillus butanolivorans]|uniref:hypothetical protein n=1 Tax=Peribacillus butanolivorans TaxID=421767 RepID=UPI000B00A7C8|nr:hypothetical protein [Peribacillus butanolivorans]
MRLNPYTIMFIALAVGSNLIINGVFKQGLLGNIIAIILLVFAALSTGKKGHNEQS